MPYKIEADEEKIVCSHFMFSGKIYTIIFDEIDKLSGGIFDGKVRGLMKVHNQKDGITIGFFHKIHDAKTLETLILSKVPKKLYDEVIDKIVGIVHAKDILPLIAKKSDWNLADILRKPYFIPENKKIKITQ